MALKDAPLLNKVLNNLWPLWHSFNNGTFNVQRLLLKTIRCCNTVNMIAQLLFLSCQNSLCIYRPSWCVRAQTTRATCVSRVTAVERHSAAAITTNCGVGYSPLL